MRIIKNFKMFESGIYKKEFELIKTKIKQVLDSHYYPNVSFEKNGKKVVKDYLVLVGGNQSKFGNMIEVTLRFADYWKHVDEWDEEIETGGDIIKYSDLNQDFKQATIIEEIKDIISEFENDSIEFIAFNFFGKSARGQKNGHTKTIEDVTDKFNQALDELEQEDPDVEKDGTINFTFNLK
jgi:hypothetical protein